MTTWAEKNVQDSGALVWNFLYKASSHYIEQSKILLKVKMSVVEFKINLQLNPVMVLADFFFFPTTSFLSITTSLLTNAPHIAQIRRQNAPSWLSNIIPSPVFLARHTVVLPSELVELV